MDVLSDSDNSTGSHGFERSEQEFWHQLDGIIDRRCDSQGYIDESLKAFMRCVSRSIDYLDSESDWSKCTYRFLEGQLFKQHKQYLRRRLIGRLEKETNSVHLHLIASILVLDGRLNAKTFELMMVEGIFPRMVSLIMEMNDDEDHLLRRRLMELLYEMSRIQRIRREDLEAIDDDFVSHLLGLVEKDADSDDPYHYCTIRVLLVLNEQYMVSAHDPVDGDAPQPDITNKVIKTLCYKGPDYKTFGENIILLLNRETETSLQLLILKLLYLLFTTSATHEYFYTNDLRVLVDVMIRNLLDLPDEATSLRHTYLRVLYPLLTYSQLRHPPHYKTAQLKDLFRCLSTTQDSHFNPIDETTLRLVKRCTTVPWLASPPEAITETHDVDRSSTPSPVDSKMSTKSTSFPPSPTKPSSPKKSRLLGISLQEHSESSVSISEVAKLTEKPGVETPSKSGRGRGRMRPPPPPPRKRKPKTGSAIGAGGAQANGAVARVDVGQRAC